MKHRISLLGHNAFPDTTGEVYYEPYIVNATNDIFDHVVVIFENTANRHGIHGTREVPQNYRHGAKIIVVWTTTATSGDVEWDVDYRAVGGNDTESLDQSSVQQSVNVGDTAPSAANERMETELTLTQANLVAGDTLEWALFRDGTDVGDTIAADVMAFDILLEFED